MPFFGSKGEECWICQRKTAKTGQFLTSVELEAIFDDVFEELDSDELEGHCLCNVCAGILKFTAQDSVAAKIKISETSEKVKERLGSAASALRSRFSRNED